MGILQFIMNAKMEGLQTLTKCKEIRTQLYGKDHEKVAEISKTIDELTASTVPPPPPPPRMPIPMPVLNKPMPMKPMAPINLGPGGVPKPPPPPPPKPSIRVAPKSNAIPPSDLLHDINLVGLK